MGMIWGREHTKHVVSWRMKTLLVAYTAHGDAAMSAEIAITCNVITAEITRHFMSPMSTKLNTRRNFSIGKLDWNTKEEMMRSVNLFGFDVFNALTAQIKFRTC